MKRLQIKSNKLRWLYLLKYKTILVTEGFIPRAVPLMATLIKLLFLFLDSARDHTKANSSNASTGSRHRTNVLSGQPSRGLMCTREYLELHKTVLYIYKQCNNFKRLTNECFYKCSRNSTTLKLLLTTLLIWWKKG